MMQALVHRVEHPTRPGGVLKAVATRSWALASVMAAPSRAARLHWKTLGSFMPGMTDQEACQTLQIDSANGLKGLKGQRAGTPGAGPVVRADMAQMVFHFESA